MELAPVPTPAALGHEPPALALATVAGTALGVLGAPSEASPAARAALAMLTLGHEERLEDLLAGYGTDADRNAIRAWWSLQSLTAARRLLEHGVDPDAPGCDFDVLRACVGGPA